MSLSPDIQSELRILIVDDEPSVIMLFKKLLPKRGYHPDCVEDAQQALEALSSDTYDLVITDKNLPGDLDGLDLLKRIKRDTPDLDVIIMTGNADMDSALVAIREGVYDYLVKPFESINEVVHRIEGALEKRRLLLENRQLVGRLESMNRNLEAQVAERTQQLEALTLEDDVTGLYNQRFLHRRLPEEVDRAQRYEHPLCVIMLDVDKFKRVNDTHDHLFGSRVLKRMGEVLLSGIRTVDMAIRYGGDEFCILLPETDSAGGSRVAERLREAIEAAEVGDDDDPYRVTVSIGVATITGGATLNAEQLLQAADHGLYAAKAGGRNRVHVMPANAPVAPESPRAEQPDEVEPTPRQEKLA